MGRGGKDQQGKGASAARIPQELRRILPADTARAWQALAPLLPNGLYLGGGTAVAVHLKHRESQDLDFFFHEGIVDLPTFTKKLTKLPSFVVTFEEKGTVKGLLGKTKIEIFHADQSSKLKQLETPQIVAGIAVAGLKDLMAMKLKVLAERGELRDYFDVKEMDEQGPYSVEEGLGFFSERYNAGPESAQYQHLLRALGYLEDCDEDEAVPISKGELAAWWRKRQAAVLRNLDRF